MTVKNITELLNAKKYAQIKKELNEMNSWNNSHRKAWSSFSA